MIGIRSTKSDAAEASPRDRYLLKTGTIFSNVPVYFVLMIAGLIAYLRDIFPALSSDPEKEEETPPPPPEDEVIELLPEEVENTGSVPTEEPAKRGGSSGFIQSDLRQDPIVVVEAPSIPFRPAEIAVGTDNESFTFRARANNDNIGFDHPGGGDEVGSIPGGNGGPGGNDDAGGDDDDHDEPAPANRAPRSGGPIYLGDFVSGHTVVITFASLLQNASDPDADNLTITNLIASSGTVTPIKGGWLFTPEEGEPDFVTLSYSLSDGILQVQHTALFRVVLHHEIDGTGTDDTLLGTVHIDHINGFAGDDAIDAREGDDVVAGGEGDDQIVGGDGNDVIYGGDGDDLIFAGPGDDIVSGGPGNDRVFAGQGDDIVDGGDGDDIIHGDDGNDMLAGGDGNDEIHGGSGFDTVLGQDGDDHLVGGLGHDVLDGGRGKDKVDGGDGDDTIVVGLDADEDRYDGGEGSDVLDASATKLGVLVDLTTGKAVGVEVGTNSIANFETIIGGEGNDKFVIGATSVSIRGGRGDDDFQFSAVSLVTGSAPLSHTIHDFMTGDRIHVGGYEISKRAAKDVEDLFEDIYGEQQSDGRGRSIRYHSELVEEMERTKIEADLDGDALYELAINLDGHHILFIAENIG